MAVKKIMCACPAGLGSSLILGMNVESVLKKMGRGDIQVIHSSLGDCSIGCCDLFVVSSDIYEQVKQYGPCVAVKNMIDKNHIEEVLTEYFKNNPDA